MKKFVCGILVASLFVVSGLFVNTANADSEVHGQIYFGQPYSPAHSAFVLIEIRFRNGDESTCSGTLISPTRVLTAAHCVVPDEETGSRVRSMRVAIDGRRVAVKKWTAHPSYVGDNYDVAIIQLKKRAPSGSVTMGLCDSAPYLGQSVWLFGYGDDESNNYGYLQWGVTSFSGYDSEQTFTTLVEGQGTSCYGDSGGPAVVSCYVRGNWTLGVQSVISYGNADECDAIGEDSGQMRVDTGSNRAFINSKM